MFDNSLTLYRPTDRQSIVLHFEYCIVFSHFAKFCICQYCTFSNRSSASLDGFSLLFLANSILLCTRARGSRACLTAARITATRPTQSPRSSASSLPPSSQSSSTNRTGSFLLPILETVTPPSLLHNICTSFRVLPFLFEILNLNSVWLA